MPVEAKKYAVYTKSNQITFLSTVPPEHTDDGRIIFQKLSGNDITFIRENVICIDELIVDPSKERVTTD